MHKDSQKWRNMLPTPTKSIILVRQRRGYCLNTTTHDANLWVTRLAAQWLGHHYKKNTTQRNGMRWESISSNTFSFCFYSVFLVACQDHEPPQFVIIWTQSGRRRFISTSVGRWTQSSSKSKMTYASPAICFLHYVFWSNFFVLCVTPPQGFQELCHAHYEKIAEFL